MGEHFRVSIEEQYKEEISRLHSAIKFPQFCFKMKKNNLAKTGAGGTQNCFLVAVFSIQLQLGWGGLQWETKQSKC